MVQKRGLGKGLGALIGDSTLTPDTNEETSPSPGTLTEQVGMREVPINSIDPNPDQPRKYFDEENLKTLAASLKEHGLIQPIVVQKKGDRYTIIAGERRWRAARMAGLTRIPAVEKDEIAPQTMKEWALIENIQRQDLNPVEEAEAIMSLMQDYHLTQEQVAQRVGRSRSAVANLLRLLTLDKTVLGMLREGSLTEGQARPLVSVPLEIQATLAEQIVKDGLNVRQIERLVSAEKGGRGRKSREKADKSADLAVLEDAFRIALGTKTTVKGSLEKGTITLSYYSRDELEHLFDLVTGINGER
jgi:ParB family chromosome partitioning protein